MSNCNVIVQERHNIIDIDHCNNKVTAIARKFDYHSMKELGEDCFNAYKHRLMKISPEIYNIGETEFNFINEILVRKILSFDPISYSVSISEDPSIHLFARFENHLSLSIVTYLETDEPHDTYAEMDDDTGTILELNRKFDETIPLIIDKLSQKLPTKSGVYYEDPKLFMNAGIV